MTRHINADWKQHVAETGVTCYTCHRGKPVPQTSGSPSRARARAQGMAGNAPGQNIAGADGRR